jgi:hypothetical protein
MVVVCGIGRHKSWTPPLTFQRKLTTHEGFRMFVNSWGSWCCFKTCIFFTVVRRNKNPMSLLSFSEATDSSNHMCFSLLVFGETKIFFHSLHFWQQRVVQIMCSILLCLY